MRYGKNSRYIGGGLFLIPSWCALHPMDSSEIEARWLDTHRLLLARFPDGWFRMSGLSTDRDQHEMISGYNHRTFPHDGRWVDDEGTIWRNAGLHIFDFKRPSREELPDGTVVLRRSWSGYTVILTCRVERAFRSNFDSIDDAIAVGRDRPIYSKNCGRAVLYPLNLEIFTTEKRKMKRGGQAGHT